MKAPSMRVQGAAETPVEHPLVASPGRAARGEAGRTPMRSSCRFCKHVNPSSAKFCNECGAPLELEPCWACDAVNAAGAPRCHACNALQTGRTDPIDLAVAEAKLAELRAETGADRAVRPSAQHRESASVRKLLSPPPRAREARGQLRSAQVLAGRRAQLLALLAALILAAFFVLSSRFVDRPQPEPVVVVPTRQISTAPAASAAVERSSEAPLPISPNPSLGSGSGADSEGMWTKAVRVPEIASPSPIDAQSAAGLGSGEEPSSPKMKSAVDTGPGMDHQGAPNTAETASRLEVTSHSDAEAPVRPARKPVAARRAERAAVAKPSPSPKPAVGAAPPAATPEPIPEPQPVRQSPARAEPEEGCPAAWALAGCVPGG